MRRFGAPALALFLCFCASGRGPTNTSTPGHGALTIAINPNPIVAHKISGTTYDFSFDVVLRETGGHPVDVDRVSATVLALGGIEVASETYDASRIRSLGFSTRIAPNAEVRYHFSEKRDVQNDLLFNGVSADVRVDGHDDANTPTTAATRVSVTKG